MGKQGFVLMANEVQKTVKYQQVSKLNTYYTNKFIKEISHKRCVFAVKLQEFNGHRVENSDLLADSSGFRLVLQSV